MNHLSNNKSKKKYLCLLTNFSRLNVTLVSHDYLITKLSNAFEKIYIINCDNLELFSKEKKYNFSDIVRNLPENVILFNPKNSSDFENFLKQKCNLIINHFRNTFFQIKIHFLLKKHNIKQVQISNIGNMQITPHLQSKFFLKSLKFHPVEPDSNHPRNCDTL